MISFLPRANNKSLFIINIFNRFTSRWLHYLLVLTIASFSLIFKVFLWGYVCWLSRWFKFLSFEGFGFGLLLSCFYGYGGRLFGNLGNKGLTKWFIKLLLYIRKCSRVDRWISKWFDSESNAKAITSCTSHIVGVRDLKLFNVFLKFISSRKHYGLIFWKQNMEGGWAW